MRIAFVNQPWNVCPPPGMGSIAIWTYQIALRLAERHELVVYARKVPEAPACETREKITFQRYPIWLDGKMNGLAGKLGVGGSEKPIYVRRFYHGFYAFRVALDLRRRRCDIIHIHNIIPFSYIIRRFNPSARIVLHMHCEWLVRLDQHIVMPYVRQCDALLGCSDHISQPWIARLPDFTGKVATIYNGVDTERPAIERGGNREVVILFVGRLTPEKAVHDLIDAYLRVARQHHDVKLRIVGPEMVTPREYVFDISPELSHLAGYYDKSYLSTLRELVPEEFRERVEFVGHVRHSELKEQYAAADILVNAAYIEPFGMPLIEAMACEVTVIATSAGGMKEIVEDGKTGYLVEAGNIAQLEDRLVRLIENAGERKAMGIRGRERACRKFGWDVVARDLEAIYEDLL